MTDIILGTVCIREKECHVIVKGIDLETSPVGLDLAVCTLPLNLNQITGFSDSVYKVEVMFYKPLALLENCKSLNAKTDNQLLICFQCSLLF